MNRNSEEDFFHRYPNEREKKRWTIPHSSYPAKRISADCRSDIRISLTDGVDCLVIGFSGEIKPYKNLAALRHLPMTDPEGRPLRLILAGTFHPTCDVDDIEAIIRSIQPHRLVRIDARPSDEGLSELIQSVDIVFMPYLHGWNSGFAMFALGCGGRLLCSALPMFLELAEALGPPWVYVFDHNAADLSEELTAAVNQIAGKRPGLSDQVRLEQFLAANSFEGAALRHQKSLQQSSGLT